MNMLKAWGMKVVQSLEDSQKSKVMREFIVLSDKQLDDLGISRTALHQGIEAYPWSAQHAKHTAASSAPTVLNFGQASKSAQAKPAPRYHAQPKLAA